MNEPKISILAPSFNHQKYVGFFIESALSQTFSDFELIIVDDCSTDKNIEEILRFQDSRIKLIQHAFNQGINAALNTAFEKSNGEILVFIASDDVLKPNALEVINQAFYENPNAIAVYTQLTRIDVSNNEREQLRRENKKRQEILHEIFMSNNCLLSPGMSMRREDFAKILYPLNSAMCNHQDTQMHIKIFLQGECYFTKESLIWYRYGTNVGNISSRNEMTYARERLETSQLMDTFLEIQDINLLKEIFAQEIQETKIIPYKELLPYFLGRMAILSKDKARQDWGYNQVMKFYDTREKAQNLFEIYGFTFKDYLQLASLCVDDKITKKYKKYKRYFKWSLYINIILVIVFGLFVVWK